MADPCLPLDITLGMEREILSRSSCRDSSPHFGVKMKLPGPKLLAVDEVLKHLSGNYCIPASNIVCHLRRMSCATVLRWTVRNLGENQLGMVTSQKCHLGIFHMLHNNAARRFSFKSKPLDSRTGVKTNHMFKHSLIWFVNMYWRKLPLRILAI